MLKFMVVVYRRHDLSREQFRLHLRDVHGPIARRLPELRKYVQNYVGDDPRRKHPGWDAIIELYFDDWEAMERAWASPAGAASDADLPLFADLTRTNWSVVEEVVVFE